MSGLLEPIGKFIANLKFEDIPEKEIYWAKLALADWVCVTMPGTQLPAARDILDYLGERRLPGKSVLFATHETADAPTACLFNGTASHTLDFDDCSHSIYGHPTAPIAPVAFACAQECGLSGREVIRGYVAGFETMTQIARWTSPILSQNGWHATITYGVLGAAAVACALYGCDEVTTTHALGLAASRACGLRSNFGTKTKALHCGLAALTGYECARMAIHGITSNPKAIEQADGFAQCLAKPIKAEDVKIDIGEYWDLVEHGLLFKQYPCCSSSHSADDAWDAYLKAHPLDWQEIEKIDVGLGILAFKELVSHRPQDAVEAKFSIEYALAARVIYGPIEIDTFTDEKVRDPRVQDLMSRITSCEDPVLAKKFAYTGKAPARFDVYLKSGEVIHLHKDLADGNAELPFSEEQRHEKFLMCMRKSGDETNAEKWYAILSELELARASDIAEIGRKA